MKKQYQRVVMALALFVCLGCGEEEQNICEELPNLEICVGAKACTPGAAQECPCVGGGSGVQTCNADGSALSDCECGEETAADVVEETPEPDVVDENGCTSKSYTDCNNLTELWWYNSCLEPEEPIEDCVNNGACGLNKDSCCSDSTPICHDGDIYLFNECGELGDLDEACPGETICKEASQEGAPPTCVEPSADCGEPDAYQACHNPAGESGLGDVYNFNTCDEPTSVSKPCACEEMCANGGCVKTFYDGSWKVTLTGTCALGSAINYTGVTFQVSGTDMTVQANVAGQVVTYTGSLNCKDFQVTGSFNTGFGTATETWSCTFDSLTHFTGQVVEEGPLGSCLYDLEGVRVTN